MPDILNQLKNARQQLIKEKELFDVRMKGLDALISTYEPPEVMLPQTPKLIKTKAAVLRDIAEEFLSGQKNKAASTPEILNHLYSQGCVVTWKNPKGDLASHLYHDKRFLYDRQKKQWTLPGYTANKDKDKLCLKV